jgi:hypothetical protein
LLWLSAYFSSWGIKKEKNILFSSLVAVETEEVAADCRLLFEKGDYCSKPFFLCNESQGDKTSVKIYDFYHIKREKRVFSK